MTISFQDLLATAVARHREGALAEAQGLYRRVLEFDPADPDALHLLGVIERQGDVGAGLRLMLRALRIQPGLGPARINLCNLLEGLLGGPDGVERHAGLLAVLRGRAATRDLVIEALEAVARRQPDALPVWQALTRFYYGDRRFGDTARAFEQWQRIDPEDEQPKFVLELFLRNARHRPPADFRADLERWRGFAPGTARRTIVTSCDRNYFGLVQGLLLSLAAVGLSRDYDVCFVDAGCTPAQLDWLAGHVRSIAKPTKEIDFPAGYPDYVRTHVARSFLPEIFPGYEYYLWLDSDMWVQRRDAVDLYFSEAAQGRIAATCDVDRAYYNRYWYEQSFLAEIEEAYRLGFSDEHARKYRGKACFNSGSFCAAAADPFWRAYEEAIIAGLHRAARHKGRFSHIIENAAFNHVLYSLGRVATLPSSCNWQCALAPPFRDEDGVVREPLAPFAPIGIIHLTVQAMRADYLRLGLLYQRGSYLTAGDMRGFS